MLLTTFNASLTLMVTDRLFFPEQNHMGWIKIVYYQHFHYICKIAHSYLTSFLQSKVNNWNLIVITKEGTTVVHRTCLLSELVNLRPFHPGEFGKSKKVLNFRPLTYCMYEGLISSRYLSHLCQLAKTLYKREPAQCWCFPDTAWRGQGESSQ